MRQFKSNCWGLFPGPKTKQIIKLLPCLKIELEIVILRKRYMMPVEAEGDNKPDLLVIPINAFGKHTKRRQETDNPQKIGKRKSTKTYCNELSLQTFKTQNHLIHWDSTYEVTLFR